MFFGFRSEEGVKSFEDGEGGAVKNFRTGDLPIWGGREGIFAGGELVPL